ncbi:MAG TPA: DNA primase [Myxococcota bacterium]|nr:DNA primase [Myxococcota bacterium]
MLSRQVVEELRSRVEIAEVIGRTVTLRRAGRNLLGLCPFHNEKTPSFNVIPDKGIYHCFGCGAGGDVISFVQKTQGLSFMEAVKELAGSVGMTIEDRALSPEEHRRIAAKADLHDVAEAAAKHFEEMLMVRPEGLPGREYLKKRGITLDTARKYRMGYAPEGWDRLATALQRQHIPMELAVRAGVIKRNDRTGSFYDAFRGRITFVIADEKGKPVAFGGRVLPEIEKRDSNPTPKYLNSSESEIYEKSKTLYGLNWARNAIQRNDRVILVEGYFDAVSLWQSGVEEVVATCGTALTPAHLEKIRRLSRKAVALFDSDEAGMRAATKSMELFLDAGVEARRLDLQGAKDPDEFVQKYGGPAFEEALKRAEPLVEMVVRRTVEKEGSSPEGRVRALDSLAPVLRKLPAMLQVQMVGRVAGWLGLREEDVLGRLGERPVVSPTTAAPSRWLPSKELSHLLWLVIHYPQQVAPEVMQTEPGWITDREDVLEAIAALCNGSSLPDVVSSMVDGDASTVLRKIAVQPAIYEEQHAVGAARQILAKMELPQLDSQIAAIQLQISSPQGLGDSSSTLALATKMQTLYARKVALAALSSRRA